MNIFFLKLRKNIIPVSFVFLLALGYSACKKTNDDVPNTPVAGLMAFNLVTDKEAVGIAVGNNNFTSVPLYYTNYTGGWRGVFVGNRNLESYDFNTRQTMAASGQLFEDSTYYSLFVIGTQSNYKNVVVKDPLDSLPTGTAQSFVRYINAVPDSVQVPVVKITSNGTDVFNSTANYGVVSEFKSVSPGDIVITANNESVINASRTITLEKDKIYTVLISGDPASTDTEKGVAIRFIANGQVRE